jgi:hypothetical protein
MDRSIPSVSTIVILAVVIAPVLGRRAARAKCEDKNKR